MQYVSNNKLYDIKFVIILHNYITPKTCFETGPWIVIETNLIKHGSTLLIKIAIIAKHYIFGRLRYSRYVIIFSVKNNYEHFKGKP